MFDVISDVVAIGPAEDGQGVTHHHDQYWEDSRCGIIRCTSRWVGAVPTKTHACWLVIAVYLDIIQSLFSKQRASGVKNK